MIYLEKFGRAEEKAKFKWGIPLHWWLKASFFGSQHPSATAVFSVPPAMRDSRGLSCTLEQDSVFSPVCGNTKQPCSVYRAIPEEILLPKYWPILFWGRTTNYHLIHGPFVLRKCNCWLCSKEWGHPFPCKYCCVAFNDGKKSRLCLISSLKNSSSEISLRKCVSVKAEKENNHLNHPLIY